MQNDLLAFPFLLLQPLHFASVFTASGFSFGSSGHDGQVSVRIARSFPCSDNLGMASDKFNCVPWGREIKKPNWRLTIWNSWGYMLYSLVWEQHIGCLWITRDFITFLNHSPRCSDPNCPILVNYIINQSVTWTKKHWGLPWFSFFSFSRNCQFLPYIPYLLSISTITPLVLGNVSSHWDACDSYLLNTFLLLYVEISIYIEKSSVQFVDISWTEPICVTIS